MFLTFLTRERFYILIYFFTTDEARKITDSLSCHSKNLKDLVECKSATFNTSERRSVNSGSERLHLHFHFINFQLYFTRATSKG